MANKFEFLTGLLSGLIAPAVVWITFDIWHKDWLLPDKPAVPYLVAILINLVILRFAVRKGKELKGYGVMTVTFVFAILVFILKFKQ